MGGAHGGVEAAEEAMIGVGFFDPWAELGVGVVGDDPVEEADRQFFACP